jgi:uncharacterized protein (TIGR03083 family)
MSERAERIAARLRSRGAETVALFRALNPTDWQVQVYTDGAAWSVREVLCHFISAERAFLLLTADLLVGGDGAPEDFDIDAFNAREVARMDGLSQEELIERFEALRAHTVALTTGLDDAALAFEGRHPFFGIGQLDAFLKLIYRHNMLHERDIRRTLDKG